MSTGNIDKLCDLWGRSLGPTGTRPPFSGHKELFATIDATPLGDVPWSSFKLKYNGKRPTEDAPPWMNETYEFWYRDPRALVESILCNTEFDGEFDYVPYRDFTEEAETRRYENFMSGDWAWMQAVCF